MVIKSNKRTIKVFYVYKLHVSITDAPYGQCTGYRKRVNSIETMFIWVFYFSIYNRTVYSEYGYL